MEINGKVHLFFEQSGVFKNEFKKLGYEAYDYDIQNEFNETDYQIDLFKEIENAYGGGYSVFDNITPDDLIIAFFPCIYFTGFTNPLFFTGKSKTYSGLNKIQILEKIIERNEKRNIFYKTLLMFVSVCFNKKIRMVFENPYDDSLHYLKNNFIQEPNFIDRNRMLRGDVFSKPTGYWFFNCTNTFGSSIEYDKEQKTIKNTKSSATAGICSTERSMIHPDYARNFICDFILGKTQHNLLQGKLF